MPAVAPDPVSTVPPEVFMVEAPPKVTGSEKTRLVPSPPTAPTPVPAPFPPLVVRDPFNVIFLLTVSRKIPPAFPPARADASNESALPPEVLIAPTAMVAKDPVPLAATTTFPPAPPAPVASAVPPNVLIDPIDIVPDVPELVMLTDPPAPPAPPDVSIDPIDIVPFEPEVVMVTELPACPAPPLVSMDPVTVTAGPTVVGLKELARLTVPIGRDDGVVVMD